MKESYLSERDKQLSKPVLLGVFLITLVLLRVDVNLMLAATEKDSAILLPAPW